MTPTYEATAQDLEELTARNIPFEPFGTTRFAFSDAPTGNLLAGINLWQQTWRQTGQTVVYFLVNANII